MAAEIFVLLLLGSVVIATKPELVVNDVKLAVGTHLNYQIGDEKFLAVYKIHRIVQRGHKSLPPWLTYDPSSSQLSGVAGQDDVGLYAIRLKASCIDPDTQHCQDKISRTFHITVVTSLDSAADLVPDEPPKLQRSIDLLEVMVGRYFEFIIPEDTFNDTEDGDTRSLTLTVSLLYGKPLPSNAWLMFDADEQKLYGIPLKQDHDTLKVGEEIQKITLIATDSQGQSRRDVITLKYFFEVDTTHQISLIFNYTFDSFQSSRNNLVQVAQQLGAFIGDKAISSVTFLSVTPGSTIVSWGNHSLFGDVCDQSSIREMYGRLVHDNGSLIPEVVDAFQGYDLQDVRLELVGLCLIPATSRAPLVEEQESKMWLEIIMPALIVILLIVIIAIILLICCRHRRPAKDKSKNDKPSFLEDRRPIIFPEELEMVDPSLKPHGPLVLPADYLSETPPAVPPHGQFLPPTYHLPDGDDHMFSQDQSGTPHPPRYGATATSDPPPYRLPPPYYNPHRALT